MGKGKEDGARWGRVITCFHLKDSTLLVQVQSHELNPHGQMPDQEVGQADDVTC